MNATAMSHDGMGQAESEPVPRSGWRKTGPRRRRITDVEQMAALAQLASRLVDGESWQDASRWAEEALTYLEPNARLSLVAWDPRAIVVSDTRPDPAYVPIVVDGAAVGALDCRGPSAQYPHTQTITRALARLLGRFARAHASREDLRDLSSRDPLTHLRNRGYLAAQLPGLLQRGRDDASVGLIMVDVDAFKRFNSELGYAAGDAVLERIAQLLGASVRGSDLVCRLGGDEFVVVLNDASLDVTARRARALVELVSASNAADHTGLWPAVTVTAGIASWPLHADSATDLLACADEALRAAKRAGGESLWIYGQGAMPAR